jgi:hypothetical protein
VLLDSSRPVQRVHFAGRAQAIPASITAANQRRVQVRAKIEAVLNRKIRLKITRRKRGGFQVTIPAAFADGLSIPERDMMPAGKGLSKTFARKTDALTWLLVKLRCMQPLTISVEIREDK